MSPWCRVSENLIVGTSQKGNTLWLHVSELYQLARADYSNLGVERTWESLKNCYKRLNTMLPSGSVHQGSIWSKNEWNVLQICSKEAQTLYGKTKFTNQEVFEQVMCHHPKWEPKLDGEKSRKHPDDVNVEQSHDSSKRSRTDEEGSNPTDSTPETPVSYSPTLSHHLVDIRLKVKSKEKSRHHNFHLF